MNACASVSVVASVMFGSAMAMLSTGKESFLDNSNDENVAFSTRIMIARHYSALTQTVVVPGEATANRDAVGVNGLLSTAMGATKGKRASKSSHLLSRSVSLMNGSAKPKSQFLPRLYPGSVQTSSLSGVSCGYVRQYHRV